jgi:hypothetical protein
MYKLLSLLALSMLALATLTACSDDEEYSGDNNGGSSNNASAVNNGDGQITLDEFPAATAQAYCYLIENCPIASDDILYLKLFAQGEDCQEAFEGFFEQNLQDPNASVQAGRVSLDSDQALECFAKIRETCAPPGDLAACRSVFVGNVAQGAACDDSQECAPGLLCARDENADYRCDGACQPQKEVGQACTYDDECPSQGDAIGQCSFDKCSLLSQGEPAAANEACGLLGEAPDLQQVPCEQGLWCRTPEDSDRGTCVAILDAGAPCEDDDDVCADGNLCLGGSCRAITVQNNAGDPCDPEQFQTCNPFRALRCVQGSCQALGDGSEGSDCANGDLAFACDDGLTCIETPDAELGTCQTPKANGQECSRDSDCASDNCSYAGETPTCADLVCE